MTDRIAPGELLAVAIEAAQTAGRYALENKARRTEVSSRFRHDVKLKLDAESQGKAENVIRARFPNHSFLGEEDLAVRAAGQDGKPALEWVIDPIDGTVNFSHGLPLWCCSVAVRQGEQVVAGAVFAPELNELYTAAADQPALCNGVPLHVSGVQFLSEAMICTGLEKNLNPLSPPFRILEQIFDRAQKCRVLGSAALDLCHVAAGRADGYFESGIYLWDIAAAGLIVQRAGGRTEALRTLPGYRYCYAATNGLIHEEFTKLLAPVLPPK